MNTSFSPFLPYGSFRAATRVPGRLKKRGTHTAPARFFFLLLMLWSAGLPAATRRYRMTWRDTPATSAVIGFEQYAGHTAHLVYDVTDHGPNPAAYRFTATPSRETKYAGMNNVFVRIGGLRPGTRYYFIIVDSDGPSPRMILETPPGSPDAPLSVVAGGDSRNNPAVNQAANRIVARLRPHFVLFGGDMTADDTAREWQQWFDDWQLTTSPDGRLTPIVPARGNHESTNAAIHELFDVPNPDVYYVLDFGGGLLRTFTLNTMFPPGGNQLRWLERSLAGSRSAWKIAQYHHAMRPHTSGKRERDELITYWASRFTQYGMDLVIESDAHTVKQTYPIRPSREPGSSQGFIRDDRRGTVYVGEGCWGAPLRANDDDKPWTRASGRFNQFKWIWVSLRDVQVRTVMIDRCRGTAGNSYRERFRTPVGLYYWEAANTGDVLRIDRRQGGTTAKNQHSVPLPPPSIQRTAPPARLVRTPANRVTVPFRLAASGAPEIMVMDGNYKLLHRQVLAVHGPGPYSETIQLPALPRGQQLQLVVKCGGQLVGKFGLQ